MSKEIENLNFAISESDINTHQKTLAIRELNNLKDKIESLTKEKQDLINLISDRNIQLINIEKENEQYKGINEALKECTFDNERLTISNEQLQETIEVLGKDYLKRKEKLKEKISWYENKYGVKCVKCEQTTKRPDCYGNCHKCTPHF